MEKKITIEDIETEAMTPVQIDVVELNVKSTGIFPRLNKNCRVSINDEEIRHGHNVNTILITEIMIFSGPDFSHLRDHLLEDHTFFEGKGGDESSYKPVGVDGKELTMTEIFGINGSKADQEKWRNKSFDHCILCINENNIQTPIVVNPEGHAYARYAGQLAAKTIDVLLEITKAIESKKIITEDERQNLNILYNLIAN